MIRTDELHGQDCRWITAETATAFEDTNGYERINHRYREQQQL